LGHLREGIACREGQFASFVFKSSIFFFFKIILGISPVEIEEVDAVLARSLAQPHGLEGLPFTLPREFWSAFVVTSENVSEFATLVKRKTVGQIQGRTVDRYSVGCP
jgi:hypothetical protein